MAWLPRTPSVSQSMDGRVRSNRILILCPIFRFCHTHLRDPYIRKYVILKDTPKNCLPSVPRYFPMPIARKKHFSRTGSIYGGGGGGGGGGVRWHSGGLYKRESLPIFNRSPEVGISAFLFSTLRNNTWQFILFIWPVWNSWISISWWALWVYTSCTSNNMNFIPFYFTIKIGEKAGLWIFWVFPAKIQSL